MENKMKNELVCGLDELSLLIGNRFTLAGVLDAYVVQTDADIGKLFESIKIMDVDRVINISHKIKSGAVVLGIDRFIGQCGVLEKNAFHLTKKELSGHYVKLSLGWTDIKEGIVSYKDTLG